MIKKYKSRLINELDNANSYVFDNVIVDPQCDIEQYKNITSCEFEIIITHVHCDHIRALNHFIDNDNLKAIYIHEQDLPKLKNPVTNYSRALDGSDLIIKDTNKIRDIFEFVRSGFEVIHTPGHTMGSIALFNHMENWIIIGDTFSSETIGRLELADSIQKHFESVRMITSLLIDETMVYAGHRKKGLYKNIKKNNKLLQIYMAKTQILK